MERGSASRERPSCADISRASAEPLGATASRVDHWIVVEYRGLWGHDALEASALPAEVKAHLQERAETLGRAKVVFVRRSERRHRPGLRVYWGTSAERDPRLYHAEIGRHEDLLDLDFGQRGEPLGHPLLLVCTHGKHDRCCARYGRPLYGALCELTEPGWVWQSSHIGGDRFAGNLVCLPEGLYFGRVGPDEALSVLDEYLGGRIRLDLYRGRACFPFAVQAAERRVREESGLTGIGDLELISRDPISFRAGGTIYDVEVERDAGELTYLTCSARTLRHPRRYAAGTPRARDA